MPLPPPVTTATCPLRSMLMLMTCGSPWLLVADLVGGEIRLALLGEGSGAFLRLLGHGEHGETVLRQQRQPALMVGVGVEGVLEEPQRGRAVLRELANPRLRRRQQLVRRDHLV